MKFDKPIIQKSTVPPKTSKHSLLSDIPPVYTYLQTDTKGLGCAVASYHPKGQKAAVCGVQLPPDKPLKPQEPVLEGEETFEWIIADEYVLAAEIITALPKQSLGLIGHYGRRLLRKSSRC